MPNSAKYYCPRMGYLSMNPFELHKHLINNYVLTRSGATQLFKRDRSRDKTDVDVIRENHKFLWDEDDEPLTWEERLAKKYYDKLFKEFAITDLSRYKEDKFAMRWQTEQELVTGKGQFICGSKSCSEPEGLKTWEVNFAYNEKGQKKNALVKLRLCSRCSSKLNHRRKNKEIKRLGKSPKIRSSIDAKSDEEPGKETPAAMTDESSLEDKTTPVAPQRQGDDIWKAPLDEVEEPSRDAEFEKYLEHLLL